MTFITNDISTVKGRFINPTSGGNATMYVIWLGDTDATVDYINFGRAGRIRTITFCYTDNNSIGIGGGESLSFSVGTTNATLSTFTPFTGGTNIVVWTNTVNGTYPVTTSSVLNIPFTSTSRIAVRSVESGTVTPTSSIINVIMVVEFVRSPVS